MQQGSSSEQPMSLTLSETESYLYALRNRGSRYGIDRMRKLCTQLNQPQLDYPVIHVAGTNGKGSVCAMIEAIFRAAGQRCGLFTSPHLCYLGERVQIDRKPIAADALCALVAELRPIAASLAAMESEEHPSFFEMMTALAMVYFQREGVDVAVVEVGLGGRLDSTNVVEPVVSVITSVSLDHVEILGETEVAIAREKAGVIKKGCPVVIGCLQPEVEDEIRKIAAQRGSKVFSIKERFGSEHRLWPTSRLKGEYQRINAALAVLTVEVAAKYVAKLHVDAATITKGLQSVQWAGRWDERSTASGRKIIFESAHNSEGASFLAKELERWEGDFVAVVGALGTVRASSLLEAVVARAKKVYLVVPDQPRACSHEELRRLLPEAYQCKCVNAEVAVLFPRKGECAIAGDEPILVTGSIYLVGEILCRLEGTDTLGGQLQDVLPGGLPLSGATSGLDSR